MNKFEESIANIAYAYDEIYMNGYPHDFERMMDELHNDFMTIISLEQAIRFGYAKIVVDYRGGLDDDDN